MTIAQIIFSILALAAENTTTLERNIFVRLAANHATNGHTPKLDLNVEGKDYLKFCKKLKEMQKRGLVNATDDMWPVYSVPRETLELICVIVNDDLEQVAYNF